MSASEFALTSQTSFVCTLWQPQSELDRVNARLKMLVELSAIVIGNRTLDSYLTRLATEIRRLMLSDFAILGLAHFEDEQFQVEAFDAADDIDLSLPAAHSLGKALWGQALSNDETWTGK